MKNYFEKRAKISKLMAETVGKVEAINSDYTLSADGKNEKAAPLVASLKENVISALAEVETGLSGLKEKADSITAKALEVAPEQVAMKAATMGAKVDSMDYDALLRLYQARYSEPAERRLIEEQAMLRIDSDPESVQLIKFKEQFVQERELLQRTLPGSEELKEIQGHIDYLNGLQKVYLYNLSEIDGQTVKGVDAVHRTNAVFNVEQYEQKQGFKAPEQETLREALHGNLLHKLAAEQVTKKYEQVPAKPGR